MATSGTTTFNMDVDEIVTEAYSRVSQEPITGFEAKTARISLNLILQSMINKGILLWTVKLSSFTTTQGDLDVTLDSDVVDVLDVYLRRDGMDSELVRISRQEYDLLPDKDSQGRPSQFYIDRLSDSTVMYIWNAPENSTDTIFYRKKTRMEDVSTLRNNIEVPQRWLEWVNSELAHKLSYKRQGVAAQKRMELKALADQEFAFAEGEESDRTGTRILPDFM